VSTKSNIRVLVVEDDEDIREILRLILEFEGYGVDLAADGETAWQQIITSGPPALILLDLMMPGMDGEQFMHLLRSGPHADVPVVIMSGNKTDRSKIEELHADALLTKPVELDELMPIIRRLTTTRRIA
jgi:DNA-binding response OmpR family regulator